MQTSITTNTVKTTSKKPKKSVNNKPTFVLDKSKNLAYWKEIIGGNLSKPSKMPGSGFGISAQHCITGGKLRRIEGSVCHKCYAFRGNYVYLNVKAAQENRFNALRHKEWVNAMAHVIYLTNIIEGGDYFRMHDSGDLQGIWHLQNIVKVAELLPHIKIWLPTHEHKMIEIYVKRYGNNWPKNLNIRLSADMVGEEIPSEVLDRLNVTSSSVTTDDDYSCVASKNKEILGKNNCGDCRACWDKSVRNVSYPKH